LQYGVDWIWIWNVQRMHHRTNGGPDDGTDNSTVERSHPRTDRGAVERSHPRTYRGAIERSKSITDSSTNVRPIDKSHPRANELERVPGGNCHQ